MTAAAIIAAILQGGPLVLEFWLKIESLVNLGPDEKTNIANAIASSDAADDEMKARSQAWLDVNPA